MWGLPRQTPWQAFAGSSPPELAYLNALRSENDVAALIGSNKAGPRGRYGVVGLAKQVHLLRDATKGFEQLFNQPPQDALRIIALGYEAGFELVNLPPCSPPRDQPAIVCMDLDAVIIIDHKTQKQALFGTSPARLERLQEIFAKPSALLAKPGYAQLIPTVSDTEHAARIRRAQEHIAAGDVYQANIARRLRLEGEVDGIAMAASLCERNPVAHSAYLRTNQLEILSNTMETLLTYEPEERVARTYPIKGTRGRAEGATESTRESELLKNHPKERAEHVMIVDLVRNDLGRVCVPGSVQVDELMRIEGFRGVWHGISTVVGRLENKYQLGDLVAAVFPGGSITGAPKRSAMKIIRNLEQESRGFYTGSIGLLTPTGRLSMSILIRTLIRDSAGWSLSVGGGIVADSTWEREIAETWEKVSVFQQVLSGGLSSTGLAKNRGA